MSSINSYLALVSAGASPGHIAYRRPEYEQRWWWWEFYRLSYVGGREYYEPGISVDRPNDYRRLLDANGKPVGGIDGPGFLLSSMLHRHLREQPDEFRKRNQQTYYYNFPKLIVDSLVSHATKRPAIRLDEKPEAPAVEPPKPAFAAPPPKPPVPGAGVEPAADDAAPTAEPAAAEPAAPAPKPAKPRGPLAEFWDGVDEGRDCKVSEFVASGARWAQVYGLYWCCVDVDKTDGDGKPYAYWVSPLDVWDWQVDSDGEIEWLKQFVYTEQERAWNEKVEPAYRFQIWYRDRVEVYESKGLAQGALIETIPHEFGVVPWVPIFARKVEDALFPDGVSLIGDASRAANRVFNLSSQLNEIYGQQTFSQLLIPGQINDKDKVQLGLTRYLQYTNDQGAGQPTFISPDANQPRVLMDGIGAILELVKSSLGVGRGRSEGSKQQASGDALELESEDKKALLFSIARECEDFERRLAKLVLSMAGKDDEGVYIQYSREFDMRSFAAFIEETIALDQVGLPEVVRKQIRKDLVRMRFDGMPPEQLQAMVDAVDAPGQLPPSETEKKQMQAEAFAKVAAKPASPGQDKPPFPPNGGGS